MIRRGEYVTDIVWTLSMCFIFIPKLMVDLVIDLV